MSKVISSHNLSMLNETLCEIDKYLYALKKLDEISDDDKIQDLSHWSGLLHDVVDLLDQHITDLHILDSCIRQEKDCG
jgi:hypothetical protein